MQDTFKAYGQLYITTLTNSTTPTSLKIAKFTWRQKSDERLKQFTLNAILLKQMKAYEIIASENLNVQLQHNNMLKSASTA